MSTNQQHWQNLVAELGLQLDDTPRYSARPEAHLPQTVQGHYFSPIAAQAVLRLSGDDAASFLHGQISNDVLNLGDEVRLAAYCTAKGRMLASLHVWRDDDAVYVLLPRELLPMIEKRLRMFVLRAKVKIEALTDLVMIGMVGATEIVSEFWPDIAHSGHRSISSHGTLLQLPNARDGARYLALTPVDHAVALIARLRSAVSCAPESTWRADMLRSGIPEIVAATQEKFVPQMINFELIDGVNFKKGCYPGQEIVARSQYLGKQKRRTYLCECAHPMAPAVEVYSSEDPSQPCGTIVNAEQVGAHSWLALVELKMHAITAGTLHLTEPSGPTLQLGELPYPIAEPT